MFPIYIYTYDPGESYNLKDEIKQLNKKLSRPKNNLQCQVIDIYDFFIQYLSEKILVQERLLDAIFEMERDDPENTYYYIIDKINDSKFYTYLKDRIYEHFMLPPTEQKSYLLIHGFDKIYPYLRVHSFTKSIEPLVKGFKVIIFYPGKYIDGNYKIFNEVYSENAYRATYLNQFVN
jgi:hypothetical protein